MISTDTDTTCFGNIVALFIQQAALFNLVYEQARWDR